MTHARACIICGEATYQGSRCPKHASGGWARHKAAHADNYSTAAWRKRRKAQLAEFPTCRAPNCTEEATEVDHIASLAGGGSFAGAVQSLCERHHRLKTMKEANEGRRRKARGF
jgi:hypothetical protein